MRSAFYHYYTANQVFCQQAMKHTLLHVKKHANIWTIPTIAYETMRLLLRKK